MHYYLHAHPELGLPRQKEVHFFLEQGNWDRGLDWYLRQFPDRPVRVESFGGRYSHYPIEQGVAERMHQVLPDGRFIYMVRDPIERMLSRYTHDVSIFQEDREPEDAFSGDPLTNWYISESLYFTQLEQYRKYFDDDRFLIIDYDSFKYQRGATMRRVFRFLEVDENFVSDSFHVERNPTSGKRRKNAAGRFMHRHLGERFLTTLGQLPLPMKLQLAIRYRSTQALYWLLSKPMERPRLDPNLRKSLVELFRPEVRQLEEFAGRRFPGWLNDE